MKNCRSFLLVLLSFIVITDASAQKRETGSQRTGTKEEPPTTGTPQDRGPDRRPAPAPPAPAQASPQNPQPAPTGDILWPHPPVDSTPPVFAPTPGPWAIDPSPAPLRSRGTVRRAVQVELNDCLDDPGRAGYNFADERVVSCEDSTVDMYLSYTPDVGYAFLVPEDTDIKDVGAWERVEDVRAFWPTDWSAEHAVPIRAGHAYVVWTYAGNFFVVQVRELWQKHAIFEWIWHSNLSREAGGAAKPQKSDAEIPEAQKKPSGPYFAK